ncbi:hypothetical protein CYMTET_42976 [Cymbomonas tetramitiformis]|uniref:Transmembrane protein n=1 Tax=Cymbomonas tetramitiformis TaxID=36881 RepID=A0AAE0C369_9CHLO|nr:hypothetical protein CYMTET_42976 [Cymbomonas tetramitiformis]
MESLGLHSILRCPGPPSPDTIASTLPSSSPVMTVNLNDKNNDDDEAAASLWLLILVCIIVALLCMWNVYIGWSCYRFYYQPTVLALCWPAPPNALPTQTAQFPGAEDAIDQEREVEMMYEGLEEDPNAPRGRGEDPNAPRGRGGNGEALESAGAKDSANGQLDIVDVMDTFHPDLSCFEPAKGEAVFTFGMFGRPHMGLVPREHWDQVQLKEPLQNGSALEAEHGPGLDANEHPCWRLLKAVVRDVEVWPECDLSSLGRLSRWKGPVERGQFFSSQREETNNGVCTGIEDGGGRSYAPRKVVAALLSSTDFHQAHGHAKIRDALHRLVDPTGDPAGD